MQKAALDFVAKEQEAGINALKLEWGNKYDENATVAQQAFKQFAPTEDEAKYLKDTGLAADPVLMRMFHRVGRAISEDYISTGDGGVATGATTTLDQHGKPLLDFSKSLKGKQ